MKRGLRDASRLGVRRRSGRGRGGLHSPAPAPVGGQGACGDRPGAGVPRRSLPPTQRGCSPGRESSMPGPRTSLQQPRGRRVAAPLGLGLCRQPQEGCRPRAPPTAHDRRPRGSAPERRGARFHPVRTSAQNRPEGGELTPGPGERAAIRGRVSRPGWGAAVAALAWCPLPAPLPG